MGFVVDKVALGQILSEYIGFPCQFSFHQILRTQLSSGAGTIGQLVGNVPSRLILIPPHEIKKKIIAYFTLSMNTINVLYHIYFTKSNIVIFPVEVDTKVNKSLHGTLLFSFLDDD
jgi:hypothetical protein